MPRSHHEQDFSRNSFTSQKQKQSFPPFKTPCKFYAQLINESFTCVPTCHPQELAKHTVTPSHAAHVAADTSAASHRAKQSWHPPAQYASRHHHPPAAPSSP